MSRPTERIVYVERAHSHGCLITTLAFLLFGWLGVLAVAVGKMLQLAWGFTVLCARAGWALFVRYPVKATWALTMLAYHALLLAIARVRGPSQPA